MEGGEKELKGGIERQGRNRTREGGWVISSIPNNGYHRISTTAASFARLNWQPTVG